MTPVPSTRDESTSEHAKSIEPLAATNALPPSTDAQFPQRTLRSNDWSESPAAYTAPPRDDAWLSARVHPRMVTTLESAMKNAPPSTATFPASTQLVKLGEAPLTWTAPPSAWDTFAASTQFSKDGDAPAPMESAPPTSDPVTDPFRKEIPRTTTEVSPEAKEMARVSDSQSMIEESGLALADSRRIALPAKERSRLPVPWNVPEVSRIVSPGADESIASWIVG